MDLYLSFFICDLKIVAVVFMAPWPETFYSFGERLFLRFFGKQETFANCCCFVKT